MRDFRLPGTCSEYDDDTTTAYTKAPTLQDLRPPTRGRQRAMSQENLKFDNDDEDGTQCNEMTAGVMNARFGDMGADDEGGNALTQYNGRTGFSQVGDNSANGDDSDKTQSE